jgi:hypothetical protein
LTAKEAAPVIDEGQGATGRVATGSCTD